MTQQGTGAAMPEPGAPARATAGFGAQGATADVPEGIETVEIRDEAITLGQLLKLHGIAGTGAEAKDMLAAEAVLVNDAVETRRGAKIRPGDVVDAAGEVFTVATRA
ncbi:RNA-binding S4 domain-containing protein [Brevibacterium album]|uniref:RNA-binding S4 domain-containing protein n=1 Tax=Brevibacterium album TaxID=417948 RepID=UPI00316AE360